MKLMITGGSGFLGGRVIPLLLAHGHQVAALARSDEAARRVGDLGASPVLGDLDDPASVGEAFAADGSTALVNLASLGFGHAQVIVAAAEEAGMERAVFVSTTAIFTKLDVASRSVRCAAEEAIRQSALKWTILRPTMIYGAPGDRNMERLLRFVRISPLVPVPGGGRGLQQPVHVEDAAAAVAAAVARPEAVCREYDLAGPEPLTFRQVLAEAGAAVGRAPWLVPVPLGPVVAALLLCERVVRRPALKAEQVERLAEDKWFDITSAHAHLCFRPRSFADGIREEAALL